MRPDASRMRPGCVRILNSGNFGEFGPAKFYFSVSYLFFNLFFFRLRTQNSKKNSPGRLPEEEDRPPEGGRLHERPADDGAGAQAPGGEGRKTTSFEPRPAGAKECFL